MNQGTAKNLPLRKNHRFAEEREEITKLLLDLGKKDPALCCPDLHADPQGLFEDDVLVRQRRYGTNEVARIKPPHWLIQLAKSFVTPFTLVLLAIAAASFFADIAFASEEDWTKVIIIGAMIALSGALRFWQEFRSQKEAEKLKALVQNKALITRRREGGESFKQEIIVSELVPGDIVHLSAGDMIPADMRLLSSDDFFVSQSALTGESVPVEKFAKPVTPYERAEAKKDATINNPLELNTLCFLGTNVASGYATGIVVVTGDRTYFGSLARAVVGERELTSFDKGISKVSWVIIYFMLVMAPLVFLLNGFMQHDWQEAFFFALAVAVGLTPEMLPLVVTANLARGASEMSKHKVIVKKLNAIQNFGAMDILCTDKTGTITENRVVLMKYVDAKGNSNEHVFRMAYLNSFFQTGLKNLIDQAVVERMDEQKGGEEERAYRKIDEIPFDFERRRLSVVVEKEKRLLVCKGAVEEILKLCTHMEDNGTILPISASAHSDAQSLTKALNSDGLRVVAVAYKELPRDREIYSVSDEHSLVLAGYVGFLDPPKASAKEAIKLLENHGVAVKIITGDNEIVTARICKDVALKNEAVLLGGEIAKLTDEELAEKAEHTTIFAKIEPLQKARIIMALKSRGHTVGFMGDGINDAAAMREADVSVSVDSAVDIAKEAADIILLKNDLHVLGRGVMEGRIIFGNIMKYIKMTTSSNFGNMLSVLVAGVFLPFLPMLPIQLLIQNLLYDISQLSLPWDRMDEEFLRVPRKWEAGNIVRFMFFVGPVSSIFDMVTFAGLWFIFAANTPAMQSLFHSGWFVEGLISQVLIVHMIRTQKIPFIQSRAATPVILITTIIIVVGAVIPFTSIGEGVGLQALPAVYFLFLIATLLGYAALIHVVKLAYIHVFKVWL